MPTNIEPVDLPAAASASASAAIMVQNGAAGTVVEKVTPLQLVNTARPLASQAEAEAGVNNSKSITPLSAKQAITAQAAPLNFQRVDAGAAARLTRDKLADLNSLPDYVTLADALAAVATRRTILVPSGGTQAPVSVPAKSILWQYEDGGDARNVLQNDGTRGGFFADYDCKAGRSLVWQMREDQSAIPGGGFRDLIFMDVVDTDQINYTAIGQKVTHGQRITVQGAHNGTSYQAMYKDLVGLNVNALGNIQWDPRGVSAITADAYQFGTGIASNEFAVNNPQGAAGGIAQSKSMAAIQAIVRSRFAAEDATHVSRGIYIENNGERITHAVQIISNAADGYTSNFKYAVNMSAAVVTAAAIVMPTSPGNQGTFIEYDTNDYSFFDRANNRYGWIIGGNVTSFVAATGVGIGAVPSAKTRLYLEASTTSQSHLQLQPGATPSAPNNGEVWFDGTNFKAQIGGVTKTFTLT